MTCARCGAQNPDGNQFCLACGTPLTAAVAGIAAPPPAPPAPYPGAPPGPPPAPLAYASPPPPVAYQTRYYAPAPGSVQAPVHRVPMMLILSAVVVLVLVMAGIGTAIAIIGNRNNTQSNSGLAGALTSPSPAGSRSPVGSPVAPQGPTATNPGLTIPVPAGWTLANKDSESITLTDPDGTGAVTVGSGLSNPSQTAQQNKDSIDKFFAQKYPDTKSCPSSATTNGTLNGASGISWTLCFTLTSGGQTLAAASALFAGANSDGGVYYVVQLVTSQANLQSFVTASAPILTGIQWKLA